MREVSVHKMGAYVAKKVSKAEQAALLAYGAEILIGSAIKLSVLFSLTAVLGVLPEVAVLLLVTGLLRTLSGGAHCSAYYRCLVTSVFILTALGYMIKTVQPFTGSLPPVVLCGITLISIYLYWRYAPQAPINKPFKSKKMELAFRWYTLIAVVMLSILSITLGTDNPVSWTMVFALLWQAFTLTPAGHRLIGSLDILLTLKQKGGEAKC